MKPNELYSMWTQFEAMMANPLLSDDKKLAIGGEWIRSLPPQQLCVSSTLSYGIVKDEMQGRLNDLKEKINGSSITTKKEEKGQKSSQSKNRPREKSVHKDATD